MAFEPNPGLGDNQNSGDDNQTTDDNVSISRKDFEDMQTRISAFEQRLSPQYQANVRQEPPPPKAPDYSGELEKLEGKLSTIDSQIAKCISDGEPIGTLMNERSKIDRQITRIEIKRDEIDPFRQVGLQAINRITEKVSKQDMQYFDVVKDDFNEIMANLSPDQQADLKTREQAYLLAVGRNQAKITQMAIEEANRKAADQASLDSTRSGRTQKQKVGDTEIPDWKDLHSGGARKALQEKGCTPDEYYKRMGYKNGWSDYYIKHKNYYDSLQ